MSTRKAAVVCISSVLGSVQGTMESYGYFSAVPYRVSKVLATFPQWKISPTFFLSLFWSLAWLCAAASPQCALDMLTTCAAAELRKDEILFSLLHPGWVRTDMGGENVSQQLKSNNNVENLEVRGGYHQTPEAEAVCFLFQSFSVMVVWQLLQFYALHLVTLERLFLWMCLDFYIIVKPLLRIPAHCGSSLDSILTVTGSCVKICFHSNYSSFNSVWSAFPKGKQSFTGIPNLFSAARVACVELRL